MAAHSGGKQTARGREAARSSTHEPQAEALNMEELRRLQLAHEGMRLLLSSEIKQAEQLFRKSRYAYVALLSKPTNLWLYHTCICV